VSNTIQITILKFIVIVNSPRRLEGLLKVRRSMLNLLSQLENHWQSSKIFFLGFSQVQPKSQNLTLKGASVAIDVALHAKNRIGAVIAISDSVLDEYTRSTESHRNDVPILITHGTKDERLPLKTAKSKFLWLKNICNKAEWKEYNKGHQMISSPEEMRDLLKFLSEYLHLRNIALENQSDVIEITKDTILTVNK
jgi:predicted esterase